MLCAMALVLALAAPAQATIRYDVSLAHPERHQFHVTMTVPVVPGAQGNVTVQMPAWDALYQIRDFGARVTDFRAADAAGNSLPVRRLDKGAWRIETNSRAASAMGSAEIRIQYTSFWDEPGPFDTQLNSDHAFINLAMILCYVPERRGEDDAVHFSDVPRDWRIAVELPPDTSAPGGAAYDAPNFDRAQLRRARRCAGGDRPIRRVDALRAARKARDARSAWSITASAWITTRSRACFRKS